MKKSIRTCLGEFEYELTTTLKDSHYNREIKENGDYSVSITIPDIIFDHYDEDEIIEYLSNKLSELLEI